MPGESLPAPLGRLAGEHEDHPAFEKLLKFNGAEADPPSAGLADVLGVRFYNSLLL